MLERGVLIIEILNLSQIIISFSSYAKIIFIVVLVVWDVKKNKSKVWKGWL